MGTVSFIVDAADSALGSIAETQFGYIVSGLGTSVMLAATVALIVLFINMVLQIRPMDGGEVMVLLFKVGLIITFALNWARFDLVSGYIIDGLDNIAGLIIGSITGETGAGAAFFAERFDQMAIDLADHANVMGESMHWVGGAMMSVFMAVILAVGIGRLVALSDRHRQRVLDQLRPFEPAAGRDWRAERNRQYRGRPSVSRDGFSVAGPDLGYPVNRALIVR